MRGHPEAEATSSARLYTAPAKIGQPDPADPAGREDCSEGGVDRFVCGTERNGAGRVSRGGDTVCRPERNGEGK